MLESSTNHNISKTAVYTEVISDIKLQIHILHLEECFIQESCHNNCKYLCYNLWSSTHVESFMFANEKYPTFNVSSSF